MIGHSIDDRFGLNAVGELTLADMASRARGANTALATGLRGAATRGAAHVPAGLGGATLSRFAASRPALNALKVAGPLAAAGGVMGAGDVLFGGDSAGNKIMDGAGMTIGGMLGSVGGPLGAAAGAGIGKSASDGLQWLFGDKKSSEQRRMEEALQLLQSGVI